MSHIHIGPDVKKKTEEEDVECEDDLIVEHQPANAVKTVDFNISEHVPGTVFLTSSSGGDQVILLLGGLETAKAHVRGSTCLLACRC